MIKIGETHGVVDVEKLEPMLGGGHVYHPNVEATEAVKRLVEAHDRLVSAVKAHVHHRPTYLQISLDEACAALAPFTDTEEGR